ncbi:hypothetical protein CHU98_g7135 [Xylaria longipes]|nr:hypothetical protein CHU98_g7135 [Xylaria longipes]
MVEAKCSSEHGVVVAHVKIMADEAFPWPDISGSVRFCRNSGDAGDDAIGTTYLDSPFIAGIASEAVQSYGPVPKVRQSVWLSSH